MGRIKQPDTDCEVLHLSRGYHVALWSDWGAESCAHIGIGKTEATAIRAARRRLAKLDKELAAMEAKL